MALSRAIGPYPCLYVENIILKILDKTIIFVMMGTKYT